MKHVKKILAIILACGAVITVSALAAGDDPLISLSYLNEIFMPKVTTKIQEASSYTIITVPSQKFFVAGEGCEFILRSGYAHIMASPNGGVCDITDGVDLPQEAVAPLNHLLIAPRNDGRGFWAANNVTLMVKGTYHIADRH